MAGRYSARLPTWKLSSSTSTAGASAAWTAISAGNAGGWTAERTRTRQRFPRGESSDSPKAKPPGLLPFDAGVDLVEQAVTVLELEVVGQIPLGLVARGGR